MTESQQDLSGTLGFFDSGVGGLTVLAAVRERLPGVAVTYLGDNARAPYGTLDHDTIFRYAWEGVSFLLRGGCPLVIVACNTASAQALRRIQRERLPREFPGRRVLGVIRPSAEAVASISPSGHIGILGTPATASSGAYAREIRSLRPDAAVTEVGSRGLVPLIEAGALYDPAVDSEIRARVRELLSGDPQIDTALLACTHFPMVETSWRRAFSSNVRCVAQGRIVADSLADYLRRHPEIDRLLSRSGCRRLLSTGGAAQIAGVPGALTAEALEFESMKL